MKLRNSIWQQNAVLNIQNDVFKRDPLGTIKLFKLKWVNPKDHLTLLKIIILGVA